MGLLLRQPYKTIYLLGLFIITLFIRLPWWFVYYSWRPNRPRKSWTLRRAVMVQVLRQVTKLPLKFGVVDKRDLTFEVPQKELESLNARFVWVPELEEEDIVGVVAEHAARAGVRSIAIPAYWILKKGSKWSPEYERAREDEKVMLYFHGGGFVAGTAYPSHPTAAIPNSSLKYSTSLSRVLSVDYRLSSGQPRPENPFPCAVIDAIAAYKHLVHEMGFVPQNITVGGESAGGNIALAVTRYVIESRLPHLPPPGGLIAASPVTDFSFSRADPNSSHYLNASSDIFDLPPDTHPSFVGQDAFRAYLGEMDPEETKYNLYLSPTSKFVTPSSVGGDAQLFSGFPRSYIIGGGAEHLFDDIAALAEKMRDDGVDVTTDFPPDAVHAYFLFSFQEPERTETDRKSVV